MRQQTIDQISAKKRARIGGALLRWAEGDVAGKNARGEGEISGEERTTRMWRDGVLFYLQTKLGQVGEMQRAMMTRRLEREVERSKSVLYKTKGGGVPVGLLEEQGTMNGFGGGLGSGSGGGGYKGKMGAVEMEEETKRTEMQLSPEQLQLFAKENEDLLKHYEDTLDQVRYGSPNTLSSSAALHLLNPCQPETREMHLADSFLERSSVQ